MRRAVGNEVTPAPLGRRSAVSGQALSTTSCGSGSRSRPSLGSAFVLPPSEEEAEAAISVLKKIFLSGVLENTVQNDRSHLGKEAVDDVQISAEESNSHRANLHLEKAVQINSSKKLASPGQQNILDLFNLLRSNPSLQRIVLSLSTDKAIWEAVMRNEAVKEFKQSCLIGNQTEAGGSQYEFFNRTGDIVAVIMQWLLENLRTKVMGLIDKVTQLVNELFHTVEKEKSMDILDDIMRSLFMLALLASLVVVITRIRSISAH